MLGPHLETQSDTERWLICSFEVRGGCANLCAGFGGVFLKIFVAPPGALVAATAALHVRTELHRAEVQSMCTVKRRLTGGNQSAVLRMCICGAVGTV